MDNRQLIADLLSALEYHTEQTRPIEFSKVAIEAAREYLQKPAQQEPMEVDQATMELAESVGLIGPTSRTHDLHQAIQRFHDLICVNATVKAAQMAADVIRECTPPQRTWVGLTDEEIESLQRLAIDPVDANGWGFLNRESYAHLIEAKLRSKNENR